MAKICGFVLLMVLAVVIAEDYVDMGKKIVYGAACEFGNEDACMHSFWLENQTAILVVLGIVAALLLGCCFCCYACCKRTPAAGAAVILPYIQMPGKRTDATSIPYERKL